MRWSHVVTANAHRTGVRRGSGTPARTPLLHDEIERAVAAGTLRSLSADDDAHD